MQNANKHWVHGILLNLHSKLFICTTWLWKIILTEDLANSGSKSRVVAYVNKHIRVPRNPFVYQIQFRIDNKE